MVWIRRRILTALVIALVTTCLAGTCHGVSAVLANAKSPLSAALLRLHVVANSDTFEDQALKLEVRDAILDSAATLLDGVTSKEDAIGIICANLDLLSEVSAKTVKARGFDYEVSVYVGRFAFPDRVYGVLRVPAGEYDAVRVTIGAGRGSNWWCVIFPPLCFIDVSGAEAAAQGQPTPSSSSASTNAEVGIELTASSTTEPRDGVDAKERLQTYLQNYLESGEFALRPGSSGGTAGASEDGGSSGRGGLMTRLEGEIGRLTRHFALPKFAIQTWMELF